MLINPLKPYLTWPQFVKLKEIKSLTLENQVKKYKQYINEIAFQEQQFLIRQGLVQGGPSSTPPSVVTGVKCIAANNEYLSSPSGNYFPASLDNLDIEFQYEGLVEDGSSSTKYLYETEGSIFTTPRSWLYFSGQSINFGIKTSFGTETISYNFGVSIPTSGKIRILGVVNGLELYFNDSLVSSVSTTSQDLSSFNGRTLDFRSSEGGDIDIIFNSIKFNGGEWTPSNWTAPTTTNSQGVVTTLYSDVSTDAMIVRT